MNTPNLRRFAQQESDALDTISQHPGITTMELATLLAEGSGRTISQMTGMLSAMMDRNEFVHVRAVKDHKATYQCYRTVPPGIDPVLFERKRVARRTQAGIAADAIAVKSAQKELMLPKAVFPRTQAEYEAALHPVRKPGAFTVDLELPNGTRATFTLDEARRMYDQLYRLFGANGL